MKREFIEDDGLKLVANKVIEEEKLTCINAAKVKYVLVAPYISRATHGRCIRASDELKHFGNLDYLIEFSFDIWQEIDDKTKHILMFHELLHVLPVEKKNGIDYTLADHDVKDFGIILAKYGVEWFTSYKDIVAGKFDMKPNEKDRICL